MYDLVILGTAHIAYFTMSGRERKVGSKIFYGVRLESDAEARFDLYFNNSE
jgi:hypothetical protein